MILYLDTSALVELFTEEPGSDRVREAVARAEFRGCHHVDYVEACAALARRSRESGLPDEVLEALTADLIDTRQQLDVIEADWPLVQRAGEMAMRLRLRGFDAVHLAAAEAVWTRVGGAAEFRFAVFDVWLADAARALGMQVLGS